MANREIALYSGWGPHRTRNPGDELCREAAHQVLGNVGIKPSDVRTNYSPVTQPWIGPVILGGGTTLPGVFKDSTAPGLRASELKVVFGSGVLSPEEIKGHNTFTRAEFDSVQVVGVRGPVSAEHYRALLGQEVSYVGDLGFAYAQEAPRNNPQGDVLFFIYEPHTERKGTESSTERSMSLYRGLGSYLSDKKVFCLTNISADSLNLRDEQSPFDRVETVSTAEELISSIQMAKHVVTERFHPAVLAACFGIPFTYLQSTSKSRDLERLLVEYGSSSLQALFVDSSWELPSFIAAYNKAREVNVPYDLIYAANRIKESLNTGAQEVAERLL